MDGPLAILLATRYHFSDLAARIVRACICLHTAVYMVRCHWSSNCWWATSTLRITWNLTAAVLVLLLFLGITEIDKIRDNVLLQDCSSWSLKHILQLESGARARLFDTVRCDIPLKTRLNALSHS